MQYTQPTPEQRKKGMLVFHRLCAACDAQNFHYRTDTDTEDGSLVVFGGVQFPAFRTTIIAAVRPQISLLSFLAQLPIEVPENLRLTMAAAVSAANYNRREGNFDYDVRTGSLGWRMTANYTDGELSEALLRFMFSMTAVMLEEFGQLFADLAAGRIGFQDFYVKARSYNG